MTRDEITEYPCSIKDSLSCFMFFLLEYSASCTRFTCINVLPFQSIDLKLKAASIIVYFEEATFSFLVMKPRWSLRSKTWNLSSDITLQKCTKYYNDEKA